MSKRFRRFTHQSAVSLPAGGVATPANRHTTASTALAALGIDCRTLINWKRA
jgi:hypothetical protein